jgi:hypothetical protein
VNGAQIKPDAPIKRNEIYIFHMNQIQKMFFAHRKLTADLSRLFKTALAAYTLTFQVGIKIVYYN